MDESSSAGFGIITKPELRPAPLFRTVGLTGLSASLPPHRRLRSVLQSTRTMSGHSVDKSGRPHHQNSLKYIPTQDRPLPRINAHDISINKHTAVAGVQRWHRRINRTAIEKEEYLFEEVWREKKSNSRRHNRVKTETRLNDASELSRRMQSLDIQDKKQERTTKRQRNDSTEAGLVLKEAEPVRRDRRPHFLPPITQSDCLLNVPLILPDNSPPPSPCSPSDVLFFPLSVPHIQTFTAERRADAPDRNISTLNIITYS